MGKARRPQIQLAVHTVSGCRLPAMDGTCGDVRRALCIASQLTGDRQQPATMVGSQRELKRGVDQAAFILHPAPQLPSKPVGLLLCSCFRRCLQLMLELHRGNARSALTARRPQLEGAGRGCRHCGDGGRSHRQITA